MGGGDACVALGWGGSHAIWTRATQASTHFLKLISVPVQVPGRMPVRFQSGSSGLWRGLEVQLAQQQQEALGAAYEEREEMSTSVWQQLLRRLHGMDALRKATRRQQSPA